MEAQKTQLEQAIRSEFLRARVAKDRVTTGILSILLTEIENKSLLKDRKPLSEPEIVGILRKMIRNLEETIGIYKQQNKQELLAEEQKQLEILKKFLPQPLTEAEIKDLVKDAIGKLGKDMGKIMQFMREKYGAHLDSRVLADIVRNEISKA